MFCAHRNPEVSDDEAKIPSYVLKPGVQIVLMTYSVDEKAVEYGYTGAYTC